MNARKYNTGIKIQNENKKKDIKTAKMNPYPNTHATQVKPKRGSWERKWNSPQVACNVQQRYIINIDCKSSLKKFEKKNLKKNLLMSWVGWGGGGDHCVSPTTILFILPVLNKPGTHTPAWRGVIKIKKCIKRYNILATVELKPATFGLWNKCSIQWPTLVLLKVWSLTCSAGW